MRLLNPGIRAITGEGPEWAKLLNKEATKYSTFSITSINASFTENTDVVFRFEDIVCREDNTFTMDKLFIPGELVIKEDKKKTCNVALDKLVAIDVTYNGKKYPIVTNDTNYDIHVIIMLHFSKSALSDKVIKSILKL